MKKIPAVLLLGCCLCSQAAAQEFPTRPVRLVVGFVPGGGADAAARNVSQKLNEAWGQSVIVDNRAGAGGNVAAEIVAKAPPDGHTLLVTSPGPIVINPYLMSNLPYLPERDLAPVTAIASSANVFVVTPASPINTVQDLVTAARAKPGGLNYASAGIGSTPHLAAELFKMMTKTDISHVAYKSAAPGLIDVIGGRIDIMIVSLPTSLAQIRAQRLKAIAVTSLKRSAMLPELPTVDETGIKGYESVTWWGLFAPTGVPKPVFGKVSDAVNRSLRSQEMRDALARDGAEVIANSPDEFATFMKREAAKWSAVVKSAGMAAH